VGRTSSEVRHEWAVTGLTVSINLERPG
jgi:hypothetical protein